MDKIEIRGARVNNLKNVDLDLPLKSIICFTGPSGSGKTSLAFHTLLAESKRRLLASYPNTLRFFTEKPSAVDVDSLKPVLPVFGLPQINPVIGARHIAADTVGLTDLFQTLFFNTSEQYCSVHHIPLTNQELEVDLKNKIPVGEGKVVHILVDRESYLAKFTQGALPPRSWDEANHTVREFNKDDDIWEIGRVKVPNFSSAKNFLKDQADRLIFGTMYWVEAGKKTLEPLQVSLTKKCPKCDEAEVSKTFSLFSPLNAQGACHECKGFGAVLKYDDSKVIDRRKSINEGGLYLLQGSKIATEKKHFNNELKKKNIDFDVEIGKQPKEFFKWVYEGLGKYCGYDEIFKYLESKRYKPSVRIFIRGIQKEELCPSCQGSRISQTALKFRSGKSETYNLEDLYKRSVGELFDLIPGIDFQHVTPAVKTTIAKIMRNLRVAKNIGLGHLQLLRKTKSLSASEYQRLLLLKYLAFEGTDTLFIFDEPSVGLTEKQVKYFHDGISDLKKQGNTIIVVEHNDFFKMNCDYLVRLGEGAGHRGGKILNAGKPDTKIEKIELPEVKKNKSKDLLLSAKKLSIYGKSISNLKLFQGHFHWVHGESGSGKSSFLIKVLANEINYRIDGKYMFDSQGWKMDDLTIHDELSSVDVIDANLNRYTSRSTVGSITDMAKPLRRYFASLPEAKRLKLQENNFSRNSIQGQCLACEGRGQKIIDMQYLEDIVVECEECEGVGIKKEYAQISDGTMTVAEAFEMPIEEAFKNIPLTPKYTRTLEYVKKLNLGYLSIERQVASLSGGEKQRIYLLSRILAKLENALIFFENISFGLSTRELVNVASFLKTLTAQSNAVVIIDQNPLFKNFADTEIYFAESGIDYNQKS